MSDEIETSIREVINGSGLPAEPQPQDPREYSGQLVAARAAVEVATAIENACEATIERMYESVKQNRQMVEDQEKKVNDFAVVLRKYYKSHVSSLSEFMAHLQHTHDELTSHVTGFEQRLQAGMYPRAGDD